MRFLIGVIALLVAMGGAIAAVSGFFPSLIWSDIQVMAAGKGDASRGAYLYRIGGCKACHTAEEKGAAALAGGRILKTPFGELSTPNITPDKGTGIGDWGEADFIRAMRLGLSPEGRHYYPAFPYASYTNMSDGDLNDLWAYMRTLAAVSSRPKQASLNFPFNIRAGLGVWKLLFFSQGHGQEQSRGGYLVNGPGHCAECHTPRNSLGGWKRDYWLAGTRKGPSGKPVSNISADKTQGIGKWSEADIVFALKYGMLPDGDVLGGEMGLVVKENSSGLTGADAKAIAGYLLSTRPVKSP